MIESEIDTYNKKSIREIPETSRENYCKQEC